MSQNISIPNIDEIVIKYRDFTMISPYNFEQNLLACIELAPSAGCIIECGVWRGGMIAGICDVLPGRQAYLFDSFEGLPPAKDIDGQAAILWQSRKEEKDYFNNCKAERSYAEHAMSISAAGEFSIQSGWFSDTVPQFTPKEPISILRLDGDWYDSTLICLEALYPQVMDGGLVIIDDYLAWDGCTRAVHDFLSRHAIVDRIQQRGGALTYIRKLGPRQPLP